MDIGVFIPIGNNGWLISTTSPQYKPSVDLNKEIVLKAERYGMDFALSMIKLRGFGGPSQFWDYNLESFTLMAGLAGVTSRIELYASVAVLTLPPAIVARMATTIDSISHGRFGLNVVSGWQSAEYTQMGAWPGNDYYRYRYDYTAEYVGIVRELWETGRSDFKGTYFQMDDCRMLPTPSRRIPVVCAGQSDTGMALCAKYGDVQFVLGNGVNNPNGHAETNQRLLQAAKAAGRDDLGSYILTMVIADETDEAAHAKWRHYQAGADLEALSWMTDQFSADTTGASGSNKGIATLPEGAVNLNMLTIVGSYATCARLLEEAGEVPGTKGLLLTFDDFLIGMEQFGQRIQPLMTSRAPRGLAAA